MKPIVLFAGALMLASFSSAASAAEPQAGWFVPELASGDASDCGPILQGAREQFKGEEQWHVNRSPLGEDVAGLHVIPLEPDNKAIAKTATKDRQFLLKQMPGCGGCDAVEVTVLSQGEPVFTAPGSFTWTEYSDGQGKDYLVGYVGDALEAYSVAGTEKTALTCRIALVPDFEKITDAGIAIALKAVDSLNLASLGMSRAGGFCGTSQTAGRWEDVIRNALRQTLYRPWALQAWKEPTSANSHGDYDRILPQLEQWSLGGFSEHAALQLYKDRIAATEKILADFYMKRFGWQASQAQDMAHAALTNAIGSGFGFYMYKPFENDEEERLRAALFSHAPMAQIRAIPLDVKALDPVFGSGWPTIAKDSILNVAIAYPQALQYLLDKGFDPNRANSFGKTPLMYASQYNRLEAARILLKAGADPNARTTRPPFDCGYSLSTTNLTPLHYAVRNAGVPLIQALLQSGAVTFIKAHKDVWNDKRDDAPIDWLHRYTSGEPGKEQNPNLTTRDVAVLEKQLSSDPTALARIAAAKVLQAEKEAAAGHDEATYQGISVALQADPGNQKALADLPLLALKTHRIGEAAASATRAATELTTAAGKASAWFNLGLVCQDLANSFSFDGKYYCMGDRIEPFLRAWQIAPTTVRAQKLVQITGGEGIANVRETCVRDEHSYHVMYSADFDNRVARVYVLHPASETITPDSVHWTVHWADKPVSIVTPTPAARYVLGSQALTLLESKIWSPPVTINGQTCGR